ncbi:MAG: hypothetical protein WB767_09790 [Nocardioides sp.]
MAGLNDLVALDDLAPDQVAQVRRIYETAFPDELTAPFDDLRVDRMLVRIDESGPAALALVRDLADAQVDTGWTFLRYYAAGKRGAGVGSLMWKQLTSLLAMEGRARLLWDVEDPDEPGLSLGLADEHRRRIAFYERLGGRLLPVREYAPPHDDGHAPRLLLMEQPLLPQSPEPALTDLVEAVFRFRYGCPASHPATRAALESIAEQP